MGTVTKNDYHLEVDLDDLTDVVQMASDFDFKDYQMVEVQIELHD